MKRQRTFTGSSYNESNAYEWLDNVRNAFNVRKVIIKTWYNAKRYENATRIEVWFE